MIDLPAGTRIWLATVGFTIQRMRLKRPGSSIKRILDLGSNPIQLIDPQTPQGR